jgi:hypothetical protein
MSGLGEKLAVVFGVAMVCSSDMLFVIYAWRWYVPKQEWTDVPRNTGTW